MVDRVTELEQDPCGPPKQGRERGCLPPSSKWEKVVECGCEGGGITLYARKAGSVFQFLRVTEEHFFESFEEYEDENLRSESAVVAGWEEAVPLLDMYPWTRLYPVFVHPDFSQRVLAAVQRRTTDAHELELWGRACGTE